MYTGVWVGDVTSVRVGEGVAVGFGVGVVSNIGATVGDDSVVGVDGSIHARAKATTAISRPFIAKERCLGANVICTTCKVYAVEERDGFPARAHWEF